MAEKLVHRNTCALIKSFIGFNLAKICPYAESYDLTVGETTCEGKKKAYKAFTVPPPA
jgi:benzoyl-CoA reductase/2-hydroxyglutaryl-CoA dehydratase subunit BcrC/BadD/HgdB